MIRFYIFFLLRVLYEKKLIIELNFYFEIFVKFQNSLHFIGHVFLKTLTVQLSIFVDSVIFLNFSSEQKY